MYAIRERKPSPAPIYSCIKYRALLDIAQLEFNGEVRKVMMPGPVHSVTVGAGTATAWMNSPDLLYPDPPSKPRSLYLIGAPSEVRRSILRTVEYGCERSFAVDSYCIIRQIVNYPASHSSTDIGLANIERELNPETGAGLWFLCTELGKAMNEGIGLIKMNTLSNIVMLNSFISTGATGITASLKIAEKCLRSKITSDDYVTVTGFNVLQVSPIGGNVTNREKDLRFSYLRREVFDRYMRRDTHIPLILLHYLMDAKANESYTSNDDIVAMHKLLDSLAAAPLSGIAGNITDIMAAKVFIPTKVVSYSVLDREGLDAAATQLLSGDIVRYGDDIVDWSNPIVVAWASSIHAAKSIVDIIRQSRIARNIATNNIVIRYYEAADSGNYNAYLMMLYPVIDTKLGELLSRIRRSMGA